MAFTTVPVSIRVRFEAMSTAAFAVSATVAGTFKTNLTRTDGPFYFLVVPHPDIEPKVRSNYRRELFPLPFQLFRLKFAGWVNRHQLDVIEYLQEENRVLKELLGARRIRFTDVERRRLARKAQALGR